MLGHTPTHQKCFFFANDLANPVFQIMLKWVALCTGRQSRAWFLLAEKMQPARGSQRNAADHLGA